MKHQYIISVDTSFTAKPDAFQLRFLSAFISTLQYSLTFSLCNGRQDSHHHFTHFSVGADPVINETNSNPLSIELFYQLDHINGVTPKPVKWHCCK